MTVVTTKGSFTLALTPEKAPKTVANFLTYVDDGFYDNTFFHRVIPEFVVQGGGYEKGMKLRETRSPIVSEADSRLKNTRGTTAMARQRHVESATSQFFINVADNPRLNYQTAYQPGYTVFGEVVDGMDVIDEIHQPLFTAIVIEQRSIKDESDLAEFFAVRGVDRDAFTGTFNSMLVDMQVKQIAERVRRYSPAGVPEIVVR